MPEPEPLRRRASDSSLGTRMTVVERDMLHLGRRFDEHLARSEANAAGTLKLLEKLDARDDELEDRQDKADRRMERLMGGVAVAAFLGTLLGPVIASWLSRAVGLPA